MTRRRATYQELMARAEDPLDPSNLTGSAYAYSVIARIPQYYMNNISLSKLAPTIGIVASYVLGGPVVFTVAALALSGYSLYLLGNTQRDLIRDMQEEETMEAVIGFAEAAENNGAPHDPEIMADITSWIEEMK